MKKIFMFTICLIVFFLLSSCSKSKPTINAGMWEIKATTVMKGAPMTMPPIVYKQCLADDDFVPTNKKNKDCIIKDQKISGNKVTWKTECKAKTMTSTGVGEVVYEKDSLKGNLEMTSVVNGKKMQVTMKMSGKRVGDCK